MEEITNKTKKIAEDLLSKLNLEAQIEVENNVLDDRRYISIFISGENLSEIIGYHGKNLDALQTILTLLLNKDLGEERVSVIVDVNDYRKDREEQVRSIAKRAIMEVKETNQPIELSPMKPYERRIIHMVVKEEGLKSESIGEGSDRRIVISLD